MMSAFLRSGVSTRRVFLLMHLILLSFFSLGTITAVAAQDAKGDESANRALDRPKAEKQFWRLVDSSKNPVAGAKVQLIAQSHGLRNAIKHKLLHETTSDADGRFQLPEGESIVNEMGGYAPDVGLTATWVTVPARDGKPARTWLLGSSAGIRFPLSEAIAAAWPGITGTPGQTTIPHVVRINGWPRIAPHTIQLPDQASTIRFTRPDGQPAVGVTVVPTQLNWQSRLPQQKAIVVPEIVRPELQQITDSHGNVTFDTVLGSDFRELEATSPEFGRQRTRCDNNPIASMLAKGVVLYPVGQVTGRIKSSSGDTAEFAKGPPLLLQTTTRNFGMRGMPRGTIRMDGFAEVTPDTDGRFEIPAMCSGHLTVVDQTGRDAPLRFRIAERKAVRPGALTHADVAAFAPVLIRGQLAFSDPNESLDQISISIEHGGTRTGMSSSKCVSAKPDRNGRFEARVTPGRIGIQVHCNREGIAPAYKFEQGWSDEWPAGKRIVVPSGLDQLQLAPLRMLVTKKFTGSVIDRSGKPIPDAIVHARHTEKRGSDGDRTDANGGFTFEMPATHPPQLYSIWFEFRRTPLSVVKTSPLTLRLAADWNKP